MEGQPGRKQPGAAHRSSHVSPCSPLVSRRHSDSVHPDDSEGTSRSYIVPSQGGGTPRPLLPEEKGGTGDAYWSPDGRKIVFSSVQSVEAIGSLNYVLRVLDLGSHQITTLPGSEGTFSPRWSPNGRFIAGTHIGAPGGLKVFDFETQRWSLLPEKGECHYPTWSSNSQFIYFWRPRGRTGSVSSPRFRRRRGARCRSEGIPFHRGVREAGSVSIRTDTPLLIRDVGTADIYALTLEQK